MSSQNYFDLLGDDENEEPTAVIARATLPPPAEKTVVKKSQIPGVAARLPMKPTLPSDAPKEQKLFESGRGGRGSVRGGRGGRGSHGEREGGGSREVSFQRESRDGFSRDRGAYNTDRHFTSNRESNNDGSQGSRGGGGGYGGVADAALASVGGYGETWSSEGTRGRGGRGGGRGRDRTFGGDADERPRRREFDRRSGSGFGSEVKRDGSGRGNWGAEGDQGSQQEAVNPTPKQEVEIVPLEGEVPTENHVVGGTAAEDGVEKKEGEEEDNELTLDEYEKILEEKRKALLASKAEERKVKADKAFASMQLVDKKNDEYVFIKLGSDKEKKKKEALEKEEKAKKTQSINEFLKPADGEKYYGAAGNRGRGRGRGREGRVGDVDRIGGFGGRGNSSGGFSNTRRVSAPRIEDPGQFPNLGAK